MMSLSKKYEIVDVNMPVGRRKSRDDVQLKALSTGHRSVSLDQGLNLEVHDNNLAHQNNFTMSTSKIKMKHKTGLGKSKRSTLKSSTSMNTSTKKSKGLKRSTTSTANLDEYLLENPRDMVLPLVKVTEVDDDHKNELPLDTDFFSSSLDVSSGKKISSGLKKKKIRKSSSKSSSLTLSVDQDVHSASTRRTNFKKSKDRVSFRESQLTREGSSFEDGGNDVLSGVSLGSSQDSGSRSDGASSSRQRSINSQDYSVSDEVFSSMVSEDDKRSVYLSVCVERDKYVQLSEVIIIEQCETLPSTLVPDFSKTTFSLHNPQSFPVNPSNSVQRAPSNSSSNKHTKLEIQS